MGDKLNHHGGFGVSGPKLYKKLSELRLIKPAYWKTCSSELLSMIKFDQIFFSAVFFNHSIVSHKAIENAFARHLGDIIQFCMGYIYAGLMTGHEATCLANLVLYTGELGHSSRVWA